MKAKYFKNLTKKKLGELFEVNKCSKCGRNLIYEGVNFKKINDEIVCDDCYWIELDKIL